MTIRLSAKILAVALAAALAGPAFAQGDIVRGSGPIPPPRRIKKVVFVRRAAPAVPRPKPPGVAVATINKAETHYKAGTALVDQGKLTQAITEFEEAIRLNSRHADAWAELGNVYYTRAELDKAVSAWQRAITLDPTFYQVRASLANASFARQDYDLAAKEYGELYKQMPNYTDAAQGLANSLVQLRRYDEAVPLYLKAIQASGGQNYEAKLTLAQIYIQLKDLAKAETMARDATSEAGSDPEDQAYAWHILGYTLLEKLDWAGSEDAYAKAVDFCKGCTSSVLAPMYYNYSVALEMRGKKREAAKALNQYLEAAPFVDNKDELQKRLARLREG